MDINSGSESYDEAFINFVIAYFKYLHGVIHKVDGDLNVTDLKKNLIKELYALLKKQNLVNI